MIIGFFILKTIRNLLCNKSLCRLCCFQSVKDIKFESNSQRNGFNDELGCGCFQSDEDTKYCRDTCSS